MVQRCGFFVENDRVSRTIVNIDWDLGFTREAKRQYIADIKRELSRIHPDKRIEDITSASSYWAREMSPIFMKFSNGESYEDAWARLKSAHKSVMVYDQFMWFLPLGGYEFEHFYCYYGQYLLPKIRQVDIFVDVFYNPQKLAPTQARACAILKLLDEQGAMYVLEDTNLFVEWCNQFVGGI